MTQFSDDDIKAVAQQIAAWTGHFDVTLARAALTALTELGWGKKPTRSEVAAELEVYPRSSYVNDLINAGFVVEDPEPEWEPTEDAVKAIRSVWDKREGTTFNHIFAAMLKHIRANPHLIGMGEDDDHP